MSKGSIEHVVIFCQPFHRKTENKRGNVCTSITSSWFQTFAVFWMLYAFFWVIPRRLNFICRRFRTLCSIFIGTYLPMKMEQTDTEVRSCNHCYSGKAMTITYSECMSLALGIQYAMRMRLTVVCGLPRSTIFFTLSYKRHDFIEMKVTEHKTRLDYLYDVCLEHFWR
jgi:hypothetical protein